MQSAIEFSVGIQQIPWGIWRYLERGKSLLQSLCPQEWCLLKTNQRKVTYSD